MTFEPLADYLQPRFGSLYSDGSAEETDPFAVRLWSLELEKAVKHYLVHEVSDEDYARFVDALDCVVPDGSREEQAAAILSQQLPWEVASASHWAAVEAAELPPESWRTPLCGLVGRAGLEVDRGLHATGTVATSPIIEVDDPFHNGTLRFVPGSEMVP